MTTVGLRPHYFAEKCRQNATTSRLRLFSTKIVGSRPDYVRVLSRRVIFGLDYVQTTSVFHNNHCFFVRLSPDYVRCLLVLNAWAGGHIRTTFRLRRLSRKMWCVFIVFGRFCSLKSPGRTRASAGRPFARRETPPQHSQANAGLAKPAPRFSGGSRRRVTVCTACALSVTGDSSFQIEVKHRAAKNMFSRSKSDRVDSAPLLRGHIAYLERLAG